MDEGRRRPTRTQALMDEYASFFVNQMMQAMRATTLPGGLVSGGRGEQAFQGMLDLRISSKVAGSLRFGNAFGKALERLESQARPPVQDASRGA